MERHNDISSAFSTIRDISASQLNTLLTFDSPPQTPVDPTQMLLTNQEFDKDITLRNSGVNVEDDAIMRFNGQPMASQIGSQIDYSIFHNCNKDMDEIFSQPWSLSDSSDHSAKEQENVVEKSVIITTPDMDHITLDVTGLQEILDDAERKRNSQQNAEWHSQQQYNDSMDSVIITSQEIEQIDLDLTELSELSERDQIKNVTDGLVTNGGSNQQLVEVGSSQNAPKTATNNIPTYSNFFSPQKSFFDDLHLESMDDIDFDELKALENQHAAVVRTNNELDQPRDIFSQGNAGSSNVSGCADVDMDDPLDDLDFDELSALENAFSSKSQAKEITILGQCQSQLELNKLRPSIKEKLIASCPTPHVKPLMPTTTQNVSHHPMDYLELNYSKTSSVTAQQLLTQLSLTPNLDLPVDFFTQPVPSYEGILDFSLTPNDLSLMSVDKENNHNQGNSIRSYEQLTRAPSLTSSFLRRNNATVDASMMPSSVKQLYDVIKEQYSDFSFMYALSAQLCQDRIPMDCFVTLKMSLLLSLASIGPNPDRPPIPIIAIGNDTYMTNYLMTTVGQLASRFVGPTEDTKPPSSNGYRNHNWLEADPILLAQGGVYYVGDWSRLKLLRAERLYKDLESGTVTVDKCSQSYTLQTAIWSHWRSFKYNAKDQQMFNKFVKIFGIPIYVAEDNHDTLVNYTLEQASIRVFESTVDHLSISVEDMRNFIVHVSQRNVDFTPEASMMLQKYFVASRSARPDCLSKQAFIVLKQFAESFAKLCLRHEVLTIDALSAIILCEHSIENIFGVGENSPPHFGAVPFVGAVDEYVAQFQQWLDAYIEKYYDK